MKKALDGHSYKIPQGLTAEELRDFFDNFDPVTAVPVKLLPK